MTVQVHDGEGGIGVGVHASPDASNPYERAKSCGDGDAGPACSAVHIWREGFDAGVEACKAERLAHPLSTLDTSPLEADGSSRLVSAIRLDENVGLGAPAGVGHERIRVWNRGFLAGELVVAKGDGAPIRDLLLDRPAAELRRIARGLAARLASRLVDPDSLVALLTNLGSNS